MQQTLKQTVAELAGTEIDAIGPEFALTGSRLKGSIGRSILDATLRKRLGVKCPGVYSAKTYGELEASLLGKTADLASSGRTVAAAGSAASQDARNDAAGVGVDIESVSSLPQAADYWEHEFYRTHFSDTEIAYCIMQENPRMHFAGRWCAKEALKKCDPSLLGLEMSQLEVVSEGAAPAIYQLGQSQRKALPHTLSISHTSDMAVAVVVRVSTPQSKSAVAAAAASSPVTVYKSSKFATLLAAAGFLVALVALLIAVRK
jgi:phosphopantetheine--protein transferase-like protein